MSVQYLNYVRDVSFRFLSHFSFTQLFDVSWFNSVTTDTTALKICLKYGIFPFLTFGQYAYERYCLTTLDYLF
jgi:hypothetical protein